ncbi:MAG: restriction endonuclease subunit S [Alphaproteobacteria bacterium]|nr:restriction endonuclease subunit S [Alphaproteobacteria bacterium]
MSVEGWTQVQLGDVAEIRSGVTKNSKRTLSEPVEVPYLRVANVQDGHLDLSEVKSIRVERADVDRYRLHPGDVLMNEGGDIDKLGRGTVWRGEIEPCLHQNHVFAVRCHQDVLLPTYLSAVEASGAGRAYFLRAGKQTTNLASINSTVLSQMPIPLPPFPEQRRIAAILDALDEAIRRTEQLIAKLQQVKQGLLHDLLTRGLDDNGELRDPARQPEAFVETELGVMPRAWRVATLGAVITDARYGTSSPSTSVVGGVPVLRIPNVRHGVLDLGDLQYQRPSQADVERYAVQVGDLLVIRTNGNPALLGRAAPVVGPGAGSLFASYLIRLRLQSGQMGPLFASLLLNGAQGRAYVKRRAGTSAGNYNLNIKQLRSMPIAVPSIGEQGEILSRVGTVADWVAIEQQEATKLHALKQGLAEDLLTGRVRTA